MDPESEEQLPNDRTEATQRGRVMESYWEDDLMQFAASAQTESTNESWQEADRPLARSDF